MVKCKVLKGSLAYGEDENEKPIRYSKDDIVEINENDVENLTFQHIVEPLKEHQTTQTTDSEPTLYKPKRRGKITTP